MKAYILVVIFAIAILILLLIVREILNGNLKNEIFKPNKVPISFESSLVSDNLYIRNIRISYTKCIDVNFNKYIFYFHGRYGNMYLYKDLARFLHSMGRNVILMDYRGYGKSDGDTDIKNILEDSYTLVLNYMDKYDIDPSNITIWGESLGSIPAIYIASKINIDSLVIYGGISSISEIISCNDNTYYTSLIYSILHLYDYSNSKLISTCKANKVVFVHSENDELIKYKCCVNNYTKCNVEDKIILKLKGTHSKPKFSPIAIEKICCKLGVNNTNIVDLCNTLNSIIFEL